MLIQRLGYSDTMLDVYVDEKQFRLHELKFQIRLLYNRAWALVRRKRHGDKEAAILSAKQARSFALIMEKTDAITLYSSFIL